MLDPKFEVAPDGNGIIYPADKLAFRKPTNEILALGECAMLAEFSQMYGRMPCQAFVQRFQSSAKTENIRMLYQQADGVADIAIGLMLLGFLTPMIAPLYIARNRELSAGEISASTAATPDTHELWVLDTSTPFGHYVIMKEMLDQTFPEYENVWGLRDGARTKFPNSAFVAPPVP